MVENIEHKLAGQVEDAAIDSDQSWHAVRAADGWLQDSEVRSDLKRSNDDLVAIARGEDVILVDVDAWRQPPLLPPDGEPAAGQRDRVEAYGVKGMKSTPWRRTFPHFGSLCGLPPVEGPSG